MADPFLSRKIVNHSFKLKDYSTQTYGPITGSYGNLSTSGLVNPVLGIGTTSDKALYNYYRPTLLSGRPPIEVIYNQSPIAKRFIRLPVEQMFLKRREFDGLSDQDAERYRKYFSKNDVYEKLVNAMCAGRLYGSAFLVFITKDGPTDTPLNVKELQRGDLVNILVFDRFSVFPIPQPFSFYNPSFFDVDYYHITPTHLKPFVIHKSRMIRFDGQMPLTTDGWSTYDLYYGVSELIPVLDAIYQEAQSAASTSQLLSDMSIPVLKTRDFRRGLGSVCSTDGPSMEQYAQHMNTFKGIYNTLFLDETDDYGRVEANISGIEGVLNFFAYRLAAACGIPATILLGRSPLGMNATGESDLRSNALNVQSMQENELRPILDRVDEILTRTSGLDAMFSYDFPSILDQSEEEQVAIAKGKADVSSQLTLNDIITTNESRAMLSGDPIIGDLPNLPDGFKNDLDQLLAEKRRQNAQQSMAQLTPVSAEEKQNATPNVPEKMPPKIQSLRDKVKRFFTKNVA